MTDIGQRPVAAGLSRQLEIAARMRPPAGDFTPLPPDIRESSLGARFAEMARTVPDLPAVVDGGTVITFRELAGEAATVRAALARFRPGPVGLLLEHGEAATRGILGALQAGTVFVLLDPSSPARRLRQVIEEAGIRALLADAAHREAATGLAGGMPVLDMGSLPPAPGAGDVGLDVDPDDIAYIIYTSGSTGHPKGIPQSHRNLLHSILVQTADLRVSPSDRMAVFHSPSFSLGIFDTLWALLNGASVHPWDLRTRGFAGLADWFDEHGITVADWIPTPFRHFMETLDPHRTLGSVRILMLRGEPVTRRELDGYRAHFPASAVLVNQYGSTEAGGITRYLLDHSSSPEDVVPAGYAEAGTEVMLLRPDGSEIDAPDEIGEIVVRSKYLTPGYWGRPDLTAAAFRPDGDDGERRFMTGDLGRFRPDGGLEHLGRKDQQVKIRGYRVEPAEIELALMDTGFFRDAVVTAPTQPSGERRLVAHLVPAGAGAPAQAEVRRRLAERLPDYLIPSALVFVAAIPTTPGGKIARQDLPEPPPEDREVEEPVGDVERGLAAIWRDLLGIERISRSDRFAELGGNSLLVARMFERIERRFGRRLPLSTLYEAPSLAALAAVLESIESMPSWSPLVPIQPKGPRPPLFFVHDHGGNVVTFADLAKRLGDEQPFYGLQARGLDDGRNAMDDLAEMAALYVSEVQKVQPRGPYLLGGFCMGGAVAYEMACQLADQGHRIGGVVVADGTPYISRASDGSAPLPSRLLAKARLRLIVERVLLEEVSGSIAKHARHKLTRLREESLARLEKAIDPYRARRGEPTRHSSAYHAMLLREKHARAYASHEFRPLDAPVLVLKAAARNDSLDESLGWEDFVKGELEVVEVPGPRTGMLRVPRVEIAAEQVRRRLDRWASA